MRFSPSRLLLRPVFVMGMSLLLGGATLVAAPGAKEKDRAKDKAKEKEKEKDSDKAGAVALVDRAEYQAALRASKEELHEVAALKLERLLNDKSVALSRQDEAALSERMVDALVRARQVPKALLALSLFKVPEATFWKAQCFILQHRFREAEEALRTALAGNTKYQNEARMALGQVLIAEGREIPGRKEFKELMEAKDPEVARAAFMYWNESEILADRAPNVLRRFGMERKDVETEFLKACAWLKTGDGKQAEILLRRILPLITQDKDLQDAATVRLAEAYARQGRQRTAERELVRFLEHAPESRYYEQAFALLLDVNPPEETDARDRLIAWSAMPEPRGRHALALFYLGQWLADHGQPAQAVGFFETFVALHPNHVREGEALRSLMSLYGTMGADRRVLELANVWRTRFGTGGEDTVDYLTALIRFARKEYREASVQFEKSGHAAIDFVQGKRALYNAAVAAFLGGDQARYQKCLTQLRTAIPKGEDDEDSASANKSPSDQEDPVARLLLEKALHLTAQHDPKAEAALQEFVRAHGDHPRAVEAHLAMAELCLLDLPVRSKAAQQALDLASAIPNLDDAWQEKIDYTRMWLAEASEAYAVVAKTGLGYLERWKTSPRRDQVRMKVAQAFYRLEDFSNAGIQFEELVEEQTESPYAEVAQFYAGKAAVALLTPAGMEKAISLWEEVVNRNGPLAREAQRQQALAKRRQGNEVDALAVVNSLLTSKPGPTGNELFSLLIEKGELLMILTRKDPKYLDQAREVFTFITQDTTATRAWRGQAGFLLSQCQLQAGKLPEALEACSDVVESCLNPTLARALTPEEYVWLYRSGFAALDVLKSRQEWEAAARLADRLASAGGDRSESAKQEGTRIRLEHFIWDK
ncbi:MAG: tetratricopeptide repeat protein [Verrucomicrobium sp.]|nr:tetratricopeptide repeat protein [Verrucomicrobium sp.]